MSPENVRVSHGALDAINRRDRLAWLRFCDPEFVNVPARNWPESAPIRGPDAAWGFYMEALAAWQEPDFEWGEVIDAGNDKIVAHNRAQVRGSESGASVDWSYWNVITFRRGKWLRIEWFTDRAEALKAAGLSE